MKNFSLLLLLAFFSSCSLASTSNKKKATENTPEPIVSKNLDGLAKAYFASGCFWCVEAVFESVKGVEEAVSGYSGGHHKNPTYENLRSSGHAEAVEVYYDPSVVSYETLVKVFFGSHDPTTLNRQGPDAGPQYRSALFYQGEKEREIAENYVKQLEASGEYDAKIVTQIVPFEIFHRAEEYHQNYERLHPNQSYVRSVSIPRLNRFKAKFPELLKETH